jgi:hypothetical protein
MTSDKLLEEFETQSETLRNPGWDSKVYSALLAFAAARQASTMKGRIANTPTDALIEQIKEWLDHDDRLRQIRNIAG